MYDGIPLELASASRVSGILEYFAPAVQLGLTATPKRKDNVDTYRYFGEPVYVHSLTDGINDGFLTPFKVRQMATTIPEVPVPDRGMTAATFFAILAVPSKTMNCRGTP